jgi:histidyl-tRNA synthetase
MELANKLTARYVLIVGENEISAGQYALKDMAAGEQTNLTLEEIIDRLNRAE